MAAVPAEVNAASFRTGNGRSDDDVRSASCYDIHLAVTATVQGW